MLKTPWSDVVDGNPITGGPRAPIRVYSGAWEQRKHVKEGEVRDPEKDAEQERSWSSFFEALLTHHSDVGAFDAFCKANGGAGKYKEAFDQSGFHALHACAALGLRDLLVYLLDEGHDPEVESIGDRAIGIWDEVSEVITGNVRPLHLAAKYGHSTITALLLERGVEVDSQATTCQGELQKKVTAIQLAAIQGHLDCATLLLDRGADVLSEGCYGNAEVCGRAEFMRFLIVRGHQPEEKTLAKILMLSANSVWRNRPREEVVSAVLAVLELMADLHMKPSKLALTVFMRNGSIPRDALAEIILQLVLYGADVVNDNGALLVAAFQGKEQLVNLMFMLGWNAGGAVESLPGRREGQQAVHGLMTDAQVMGRVPNMAARSLRRLNRATEMLSQASGQVPPLQIWCRWAILAALQDPRKVNQLPITPAMKTFILLKAERQMLLDSFAPAADQ